MGNVRIALTISGAVSVGAFEGGAIAALLTGTQAVQRSFTGAGDPPMRVDAIGGASAGAMTATMAAAALVLGLDAHDTMVLGWVTGPSLERLMKGADASAPLSMDTVRQVTDAVLAQQSPSGGPVQKCTVHLRLAIANLRGLSYEVGRLQLIEQGGASAPSAPRPPIRATTYLDWSDFRFIPGLATPDAFRQPAGASAAEVARASGANEFGFPPQMLQRSRTDYMDAGVLLDNFPAEPGQGTAPFWFTDGGTLNNEPLGRTLDLTNQIDKEEPLAREDTRLHLLIHPFPDAPPSSLDRSWADPGKQPSWLRTFARAYTLIRSQFLYSDLVTAEKTNSRKHWRDQLDTAMAVLLTRLPQDERAVWHEALSNVLAGINRDRAQFPRSSPAQSAAGDDDAPQRILSLILDEVTGLANKHVVAVEIVTPQLVSGGQNLPTEQLLAGEFLNSFGGFLDEGLRWSDFALGYAAALNWMNERLGECGLEAGSRQMAVDAALQRFFDIPKFTRGDETRGFTGYGLASVLIERAAALGLRMEESWQISDFASTTLASLPAAQKLSLVPLILRIVRIAAGDLIAMLRGRGVP